MPHCMNQKHSGPCWRNAGCLLIKFLSWEMRLPQRAAQRDKPCGCKFDKRSIFYRGAPSASPSTRKSEECAKDHVVRSQCTQRLSASTSQLNNERIEGQPARLALVVAAQTHRFLVISVHLRPWLFVGHSTPNNFTADSKPDTLLTPRIPLPPALSSRRHGNP